MQADDARGCTPPRRSAIVLGLVCLLAFGASAQTPSSPYGLRTEKCPVLQDVFERMQADAAEQELRFNPREPPEKVRRDILERLETVDLDTLRRFFACFQPQEWEPPENERRLGVVQLLTVFMIVGYVDVPWSKDLPGSTVAMPKYALVTCHVKADGARWCEGRYHVDG